MRYIRAVIVIIYKSKFEIMSNQKQVDAGGLKKAVCPWWQLIWVDGKCNPHLEEVVRSLVIKNKLFFKRFLTGCQAGSTVANHVLWADTAEALRKLLAGSLVVAQVTFIAGPWVELIAYVEVHIKTTSCSKNLKKTPQNMTLGLMQLMSTEHF